MSYSYATRQRKWAQKRAQNKAYDQRHKGEQRDNRETYRRRARRTQLACEICGWSETIDLHHEPDGSIITLCPNHHSLVSRKELTLKELLARRDAPQVRLFY